MQTVRRLYLYLMSGIALGVLLVGLDILLTVVLHAAGIGRGEFVGGSESDRQGLSLAAALIVVGLLVWTVHWLLIERGLRAGNPAHDAERGAAERALYFTVVLAALLVFGVLAGIQLMEELASRLFGVGGRDSFVDIGASLATVIVTAGAWAYHVAIRQRDLRAGPLSGAGAWMPRVYLYGAALVGLIFTALNVSTLLGTGVLALSGRMPDFDVGDLRERQAAIAIAGIVAWGIVWLGHWWYATRLTHGTGWRSESERRARLRIAFLVAAIGSMALGTAIFAVVALFGALRQALGAPSFDGSADLLDAVAVPAISALPWAAAWWLHRSWLLAEARAAGDPARVATAERLEAAVVALIGLGALAGGLAGLLGLLIDAVGGGNRTLGDLWKSELAGYLAAAAVGALLWLWNWLKLQGRRDAEPRLEASSTVRRAYLLLVVGATIIASLGSLAFVLYRLFASILG
ncbi:MAG TPA: DUF5671 domain-containing protein, partial [Candidatus Limnocylindria bacterium]|nr:DUF5671 domain-containing protein [Candidatus Limnocylindria bacterium]